MPLEGIMPTQPLPMGVANVVLDERGVVMPMTPVTRRRAVLQRELSESLRRSEFCRAEALDCGSCC